MFAINSLSSITAATPTMQSPRGARIGRTSPARAICRGVARVLIVSAVFSSPALAQWQTNPVISASDGTSRFIMVPVAGGVAAFDEWNGFVAHTLDSRGLSVGGTTLPGFGLFESPEELVGCSVGPDDFALAFRYTGSAAVEERIHVAQFHYDVDLGYLAVSGPVTIGKGSDLSIAPNLKSDGTIDGVLVAWQSLGTVPAPGGGSFLVHEVRQQGVRTDGSKIWDGLNGVAGALVWSSVSNPSDPIYDAPTVVSDGGGLAIVTYRARGDGAVITDGQSDFRMHCTTKLDSAGTATWSLAVPGQTGNSPGDCVVTRDGTGGAFYCYANERLNSSQMMETSLIAARVDSNGVGDKNAFWSKTPTTPLIRPLAIVPTRYQSAVVAYRDELMGIRSIAFGDTSGVPILWTTFLQGATATNTEEVDGVLGPSYVAFAWTANDRVVSKGLDEVNGNEVWGTGVEVVVNGFSPFPVAPIQPRIVPTDIECGFFSAGFIIGWWDGASGQGNYFAERLNDGGFTAMPCAGGWFKYGSGLAGTGGLEPILYGAGYPEPGAALSLSVGQAAPSSTCALFIGFSAAAIPFRGGSLLVSPPFQVIPLPLNAAGENTLPVALPNNPNLSGLSVYLQAFVVDSGAPFGISSTRGVQLVIG